MSSPRPRGSADHDPTDRVPRGVLPAPAGVSRAPPPRRRRWLRPPRARGGQPPSCSPTATSSRSSPRPRGSAGPDRDGPGLCRVLPAPAGVSRRRTFPRGRSTSPPRARGGQPPFPIAEAETAESSPRPRGSAGGLRLCRLAGAVLSAPAGVSRSGPPRLGRCRRPPRARGGQPRRGTYGGSCGWSYPRPRGSAAAVTTIPPPPTVLPAPAGVSRGARARSPRPRCPPRARGGQPIGDQIKATRARSSPRPRGSAAAVWGAGRPVSVLPAPAGVSRSRPSSPAATTSPPRTCGGQPVRQVRTRSAAASSPHLRGSAARPDGRSGCRKLLPCAVGGQP